jgi:SAM-dependent methyltransferase
VMLMSLPLKERANLIGSREEHWKPPAYISEEGARAALRARVLRFFDLQAGTIWEDLARELPRVAGTVVDVGCGVQPYRQLFDSSVRYIGIDYAVTRDTFRVEAPDTVYYSGDRWPVESGVADVVLCTETLEHVATPDVFLSEMHRCLKPGGRAILTVPFAARWHFIPHDYWRPTPSGLEHVLTKAGFTQIGVYGRGNQLTVACYKGMGFIYSLLSPQRSHVAFEWFCRLVGAVNIPPMVALAVLANVTRGWQGRVDFLGFTVTAEKPT